MHVTVVWPDELGVSEEKQWREFQNSYFMGTHPCLSLTYVRIWSRANGIGRVAVVEDGGVIRGFLPFEKRNGGVASTPDGGAAGLNGLISSNDPIDLRTVVRRAGLRGWRFTRAPEGQHSVDPYRYQGDHHWEQLYFADLRNGYDHYMQVLPKGVTKRISRTAGYRRALEREIGKVSLEWNSSDPSCLPLLIKWKSDQFTVFRTLMSDPSHRRLVQELADSDNEDCSGMTSVLWAGKKPLSIILSLRCGNIIHPWTLAYDPEYSRFSPGTIEWLALFEEAASRGVEIIDFGIGAERYKQWFGNGSYRVGGGGVWASRLESSARSLYRRARYRNLAAQSQERDE